jgi:hypothetical protein
MIQISAAQAAWHRLLGQGLRRPFAGPEQAASAVAGIQAQILPAAGLALACRTAPDFSADDLARLLYGQRRLIKLWGQRGTLHLYPSAEWPLIHAAIGGALTGWEQAAERRGVDFAAEQALIAQVAELLRERGTLGRSDLRASGLPLGADHLSGWGGVFAILVRRGLACHAEPLAGEARLAHREHWLPELAWELPEREAANAALARRYFAASGPASLRDLAYWRGRTMAEARRWLDALAPELEEVRVDGVPQLVLRSQLDALAERPPAPDGWPVLLLPRFDTLMLTHREKGHLVAPEHYARVWRPAGHIEATLLVRGRIAGTWRYDWRGGGLAITIAPFTAQPAYVRRAAERRAAAVARHFATPLAELIWTRPEEAL